MALNKCLILSVMATFIIGTSTLAEAREFKDTLMIGLEPGAGFVLDEIPNSRHDFAGTMALRVETDVMERFALGIGYQFASLFPHENNGGREYINGLLAGGRLLPELNEKLFPWVSFYNGLAMFGSQGDTISRYMFQVGVGLDFKLSEQVKFGPFGRYDQIVRKDRIDRKISIVGLHLEIRLGRPDPPPVIITEPIVVVAEEEVPVVAPVNRQLFYDYNEHRLGADHTGTLELVVLELEENPEMNISVMGHTDSKGRTRYNSKLSKRRAKHVVLYLKRHGIDEDRIDMAYAGELEPLSPNAIPEGRDVNRRVELKYLF